MDRFVLASASAIGALVLGSETPPPWPAPSPAPLLAARSAVALSPAAFVPADFGLFGGPHSLKLPEALQPPRPPPSAKEALRDGVLIIVSLASQQAFVFKKGELWDATPVSTGRPGYETPTGVFPILEKDVLHRSTLYDDAPMPYMQRLTWGGVALHAGRVPGYRASHGCIRLPQGFAQKLYSITNFSSTIVLVTDKQAASADQARKLA